jgi:hypothetical protein
MTRLRKKPSSKISSLSGGKIAFVSLCCVVLFGYISISRDTTNYNVLVEKKRILATAEPTASDDAASARHLRTAAPLEDGPKDFSSNNHLPRPHSLHPSWKLWHEMTAFEQNVAMKKVGVYLSKYGSLITNNHKSKQGKIIQGHCEAIDIGGHKLCGPKPAEGSSCNFFSFGINDDPSFDTELAKQWNCRGFAGDPTVNHPSKLHPLVTFHNIGATMLNDNEERLINKGGESEWWTTSMPKLKDFLKLDHVDIIKLDCEGCEVALSRDILAEDASFLHHVDQLSIETHVTKTWINSTEEVYYFGLQFALLEEAGFQLEWSNIFGCSKRHEVTGCVPEMEEYGFPCGHDPWPGKPNVVKGVSCQDFLWKRYPILVASPESVSVHVP